jgi:16S rRNA (adenine1518-N6/adenine1519-N6)-dimethyltransferase
MNAPRQTISYIQRRLREVGLRPTQRHGQNFLIDLNLLDLLAETAKLGPKDVVLEVGTGLGSLTARMAERAAYVVSVEIDVHLHQLASEELADKTNVLLLQQDALRTKNRIADEPLEAVRAALAAEPGRQFKLCANLPYNVATPVLSNLLVSDPRPISLTATIQLELAERIAAAPGTKDYSALSIWIQSLCDVEIVRTMAPSVFWPRPNVQSAIIQITPRKEKRARLRDPAFFHQFVRALFLHRRKFLRGVLVTMLKEHLPKERVDALLAEQGYTANARAEEIDVDRLIALSDAVQAQLPADVQLL